MKAKLLTVLLTLIFITGCVSTRTYIQTVDRMAARIVVAQAEALEYKQALQGFDLATLLKNPNGAGHPQIPVVGYSFKPVIVKGDTIWVIAPDNSYHPFVKIAWGDSVTAE